MKKQNGLVKVMAVAVVIAMVITVSTAAFATEVGLPAVEKEDRFDIVETENGLSMISRDGTLVIHVNDGTEIIFEDGTDARERLADNQTLAELLDTRKLIVSYRIATFSLPAQTTPEKIVILYETAVTLPAEVDGGSAVGITPPIYEFEKPATLPATEGEFDQILNGKTVVKGETIDAPAPYYSDGVLMLPVRAIAEALGYEVNWDNAVKGVRLGLATNLWIGKDYYTVARMAPIELGAAPELTGEFTYVPATFFGEVIRGYDVHVYNGWVLIETELATGSEVPEGVEICE